VVTSIDKRREERRLNREAEAVSSLRSKPSAVGSADVELVAEALRDFKFQVGPITLEMLKVGQAVYLTPGERHQIARAAIAAMRSVEGA
jgi:hypothetical protein